MDDLQVIGRAEIITLPEIGLEGVHARVDTGARTSAIWASKTTEKNGVLSVVFFGKSHPCFTGKPVVFNSFKIVAVSNSTGQVDERYMIRTLILVKGRRIRASFTLSDRSSQVYPVLVGRNILSGKFIVNVKVGTVLADKERERELTKLRVAKKLKRS